jgi:hypothetical protein
LLPRVRVRPLEWCALAGAIAFSIANGFDVIPAPPPTRLIWLVLVLVLLVMLFIGVCYAIARWQRDRWRALVPAMIAIGGFPLALVAADVGLWHRDREFRHALPAYERLVDRFRSGALPQGILSLDSLPGELRGCCYRVVGLRDTTGQWLVEFWVAHRFPVHHEGWMYYSGPSGREAARSRAWYSGYRVAPHWYRVAD